MANQQVTIVCAHCGRMFTIEINGTHYSYSYQHANGGCMKSTRVTVQNGKITDTKKAWYKITIFSAVFFDSIIGNTLKRPDFNRNNRIHFVLDCYILFYELLNCLLVMPLPNSIFNPKQWLSKLWLLIIW